MNEKTKKDEVVQVTELSLSDAVQVELFGAQLKRHIQTETKARKTVADDARILVAAVVAVGVDCSDDEFFNLSKLLNIADKAYEVQGKDAWQYYLKQLRLKLQPQGIQMSVYAKKDALHGSRYPVTAIKLKKVVEKETTPRNTGNTGATPKSAAPVSTPSHGVADLEKHIQTLIQSNGVTLEQIASTAMSLMSEDKRSKYVQLLGLVSTTATPRIEKAYVAMVKTAREQEESARKAAIQEKEKHASLERARKAQHVIREVNGQ